MTCGVSVIVFTRSDKIFHLNGNDGNTTAHSAVVLCFCVCQVNGQNVVKVGHRQVVNMIRQGGNSLMVKVVMVARNPELEDTTRKKGRGGQTFLIRCHMFLM